MTRKGTLEQAGGPAGIPIRNFSKISACGSSLPAPHQHPSPLEGLPLCFFHTMTSRI